MGRLKAGVTIDQANTEFVGLARRLAQDNPKTNQTLAQASVRPLLHALTGVQLRQQVWGMLAAVILVLLIACVNVMNMQFGRITLRAKEVAIRGALGATHWRIVRQMLTESLVVASLGAIAGVAIAYWAVDMFVQATNASPVSLAVLDAVQNRWAGVRLHDRRYPGSDHRIRTCSSLAQRAWQCRRNHERGRTRQY